MRARPAHGKYGPISLTTSRRIGCFRQAGQYDADQSSERRADPIHFLGAEARNERIHVGAVLRERILVGIPQTAAAAAADKVGADHAPPRCREMRQRDSRNRAPGGSVHERRRRGLRLRTDPSQRTPIRESPSATSLESIRVRSGSGLSPGGQLACRPRQVEHQTSHLLRQILLHRRSSGMQGWAPTPGYRQTTKITTAFGPR